jgi:hypothetical protein
LEGVVGEVFFVEEGELGAGVVGVEGEDGVAVAGCEDDSGLPWELGEFVGEVDAVAVGQADVDEDGVGACVLDDLERLGGVRGGPDGLDSEVGQDAGGESEEVGVIVDDQRGRQGLIIAAPWWAGGRASRILGRLNPTVRGLDRWWVLSVRADLFSGRRVWRERLGLRIVLVSLFDLRRRRTWDICSKRRTGAGSAR